MASRVNTRFVIILIVSVIAMLGLLMLAYSVARKSASDLAKRGDALMAEGEYKQAEFIYSKAVNKDATNTENLRKWVDALEKVVPDTETEYRDRFMGDYIGAIKKTATILRNDVDAHEKALTIHHEMLTSQYSRTLADRVIEDTSGSLAFFDGAPDQVHDWERLKRYRGLAIVSIAKNAGVLEDDQYAMARDDLERAILVNPADAESVIGLMNINIVITNSQAASHDVNARIESMRSNIEIAESFLSSHPGNIRMMTQLVLLKVDLGIREANQLETQERISSISASLESHQEDLQFIYNELVGSSVDQLNMPVVNLFIRLESMIAPDQNLSNSRRLIDLMLDSDKDNAELLMLAGGAAREAGDLDESIGWYSQIDELETKPLSLAGWRQYEIQRQGLFSQSEIRVDQAISLPEQTPQAEIDSAIQIASQIRDRYASTVPEDSLALMLIDGKIAQVRKEHDIALSHFKKFNEQMQRLNSEGLWLEANAALSLDQIGVARDALTELIPIDTNTSRKLTAMLRLAQIEMTLQDYNSASQLFKDMLVINPNWQVAIDGLDSVSKLLNPELNEDPVIAAIYTARQLRQGTSNTPGDYAGAIQYLRQMVESFEYDPRIARELVSLLFSSNDIEGAKSVLAKCAQANPDDSTITSMIQVFNSGDSTDILIEMISQSERDTLDKLLSIAQVAAERNRDELFSETVAELNSIAPNDKRVIEMMFVDAMKTGDIEKARSIASRSDLNRVDSLSFLTRIAIAEKDPTKAMDLIEQAAASGAADASVYQLLAMLQRESKKYEDSLQSFEQALAISPNNPETITEYLLTLVTMSKYDDALSTARRMQQYGSSNPIFMNIWLNLESIYGGEQGRNFAVRQRERMLELNPTDIENKAQLAKMYVATKQWDASRMLINQLRSENDDLLFVQLDATWHADQGSIDGRNGLVLANEVFANYISTLDAPVGASPYVANAEFMLRRGRPDLAIKAANEAVVRQTPESMLGSKLLGDLYMSINNFSEAVDAYKAVIESNADSDFRVHSKLIETFVRLQRYPEAQVYHEKLPEEMRTNLITMLQAADIARGLEDNSTASKILDDAVALYPNDPYVYIKRAETMVGDESLFNDMLSDLGRAIDIESNNWQAYRVRAAGYFAIGRRDDALNDLRTAVRMNPSHDRSVYAVLNELLSQPGRGGEALEVAREVVSRRPDDANLMARVGGLFASHSDWIRASEMFGLAWDKRHAVSDGAVYIDSLVRMDPPDAQTANEVITELSQMVGSINESAGLLAAQALVLQARGRDDFAQQQITKAFDLSVDSDSELLNWSGNLSRYFEGKPREDQIQYLEALKRRNTNVDIHAWLDLFIARRLVADENVDERSFEILNTLKSYSENTAIQIRAYRIHGSTLFAQKNFEEAAQVWESALELFSDDWEINNNLAYVLSAELDRSEEALSYGQKAIDQNIARSEAYETMAGIYIRLKKFDEAEQMIDLGSNYIQNVPARVTMILSSGRLELARGNMVVARSKLNDAQSVLRASPAANSALEEDIEEFEQEINSAGP
jgi:tetratricopeptide (TPR) repeat protein